MVKRKIFDHIKLTFDHVFEYSLAHQPRRRGWRVRLVFEFDHIKFDHISDSSLAMYLSLPIAFSVGMPYQGEEVISIFWL